jgi:hypothetical protein
MLKKIGLAVLAPVLLLLASASTHPAQAHDHWGVYVGPPVYTYPYSGYPYYYYGGPYGYYGYPYYGYGWGHGHNHAWHEAHEHHEHHEHHHH